MREVVKVDEYTSTVHLNTVYTDTIIGITNVKTKLNAVIMMVLDFQNKNIVIE